MSLDITMFFPILPEILLLVLAILILALDLILPRHQHKNLGWVAATGLGLIMLSSLAAWPTGEGQLIWGGMLRYDWLGFVFKLVFLFGAAITALFAMDVKGLGDRGEFYLLMLASTLGMAFMASAADIVMLYLAIETTSIPLYILAGFFLKDKKSTEAGFKYLLFGAMTSAIMLYGLSLLYGFAGTTDLYAIAANLLQGAGPVVYVIGSLVMVLIGFGFKISAVPLHFWAPDVYEGAPTPIAGFLSTASKAAGFAVVLRVLQIVFPAETSTWTGIMAVLSVASMTIGNLIAISQKNIKRLLAFSSIAHAGYAMIGIVAGTELGVTSVVFYLIAYLATNLAAFGVVSVAHKGIGSDDLTAYYGLSRRSPGLALAMLVAFLSLAGMPPFGGFIVKVFVFAAAVNAGLIWLAVVGVLNSIIGLYYYLTVLKYVYLYRQEGDEQPLAMAFPNKLALIILSVAILVIGSIFAPWFGWATSAAAALF